LVHFWSRSRQRLWKKGESSGHCLELVEMKRDCDSDTLLVRALPRGPTCHTGSLSCFGSDGVEPPPSEWEALYDTICARKAAPTGTHSYVRALLDDPNPQKIGDKIREEAGELAAELGTPASARDRIVAEAADLLFHLLVALCSKEVTLEEVARELRRRA